MAKTNTGLVKYAKAQLGKPYWWGGFGQKGTIDLLTRLAKMYPYMYPSSRINTATKNHLGKKVHDCVGLIKGYLWCDDEKDNTPKYVAAQDKSANGMYNACKERGNISTMPDIEGVLVFMTGHVGVYIGNGDVIEAKGFEYGVVKTKLKGRGWTKWGKCPYITYTTKKTSTNKTTTSKKSVESIAKEVIAGKWGQGDERKSKLKSAGYDPVAVQNKVNELLKGTTSEKKTPKVGSKVKITGKYASSSTSKSAGNSKKVGTTAYIVKIYTDKAYPYQIGVKKGDTSSTNTIGFAKSSALTIL